MRSRTAVGSVSRGVSRILGELKGLPINRWVEIMIIISAVKPMKLACRVGNPFHCQPIL